MAVTLADVEKSAKDAYGKKFIQDLARHEGSIFPLLPAVSIPGLRITSSRINALPSTGKRSLNGNWTEATGRTEDVTETVHIYGGEVAIDTVAAKVKAREGMLDQVTLQTQLVRESLIYTFNNDFINGDHGTDPTGLEGLAKRITNGLSRYDIQLENAGVGLDTLASLANANKWLSACHAAIKYIGGVDLIVCNERTKLGFGQALRYLGQGALLAQTKDQYERVWDTFMGAPIVDVGYKSDLATEIITNTQGTDTASSSIYFIRKGNEEGLNLIQLEGTSPEPYDPFNGGESSSGPKKIRRVEWAIGLMNMSRHASIARVKGFKGFLF